MKTDVTPITAFRLELLTDPNLPLGGPGRSIKGTGALTEFRVEAKPADGKGESVTVKFSRATADVNPPEAPLEAIFDDKKGKKRKTGPIGFAIDGKNETAWGIDVGPGRRNQSRKAVFTTDKPVSFPGGTILTFHLAQNHGGWNSDDNQNCNLGRFRSWRSRQRLWCRGGRPGSPARAGRSWPSRAKKRTAAQTAAVFQLLGGRRSHEWNGAQRVDRFALEAASRGIDPTGGSPERVKNRPTHLLLRGRFSSSRGKTVEPGVPSFLNPLPPGARATRLTFARWLVDRNSPTTARSLVNRVWQAYFGTGLAATSEDLGLQCDPPSHPELLDWLAVEFMENSWSLKHLHRLIVDVGRVLGSARGRRLSYWPETPITGCWPAGRGRELTPSWCATLHWRRAGSSTPRLAVPVYAHRHRRSCSSRRLAMARKSGSKRPAPNGIGGPFTHFAIGRSHIRCCRRSMPPTAISPACAARDPIPRCRRSRRSTSRFTWSARGPWRFAR